MFNLDTMSPQMARWSTRRYAAGILRAALVLGIVGCCTSGCQFGQLVGGMAESARRAGSTTIPPKYAKLVDKDFAVIVSADRAIQADWPDLVPAMTQRVTKMIAENSGASGYVPAAEVVKYQYKNPGWVAKPLDQLAKELEAQRLIYIDLREFSLTDPGNPYIYNGIAAGVVSVIEPESAIPTDFAFSQPIRVTYPDNTGFTPEQLPKAAVFSELANRFINRVSWLFYEHEESNIIKY